LDAFAPSAPEDGAGDEDGEGVGLTDEPVGAIPLGWVLRDVPALLVTGLVGEARGVFDVLAVDAEDAGRGFPLPLLPHAASARARPPHVRTPTTALDFRSRIDPLLFLGDRCLGRSSQPDEPLVSMEQLPAPGQRAVEAPADPGA
jgi:hypothetical protein